MTKRRYQQIVRGQIKDFCEMAAKSGGMGPPNDPDAAIVYWLTAAVYWWGFVPDPLAPVAK